MKENEIRPQDLFKKYLELSAKDAISYFSSKKRDHISCPACGKKETKLAFKKSNFSYVTCSGCHTLYQSPRPKEKEFARFYTESPSAYYWAKTFFPAVAEIRRVRLFRPKVKEIASLCRKGKFQPKVLADIGSGYGLFLEEWRKKFPSTKLVGVEPNPELAAMCRQKKFNVVECFADQAKDLYGQIDLAVALEVIEHVHDPLAFCSSIRNLLRINGRALFTGLTVDGFDIQALWQDSNSISPPHHINFMSVSGFNKLFKRAGFSRVEIFTPGKLDVDIVKNAIARNPNILKNQRFLCSLFKKSNETLEAYQRFLSENKLSSHCWIWATK